MVLLVTKAHDAPVAAEYALVSRFLKDEAWTKIETRHGELLVSCTQETRHNAWSEVAEDRRFELLRGCPQHAFQQGAPAFTPGRDRS